MPSLTGLNSPMMPWTKSLRNLTPNESKVGKTNPAVETAAVNVSSSNAPKGDKAMGTKLDEFNYGKWHLPTNDWIAGAAEKGFDSMAVMQLLVKIADMSHAPDGSHSQGTLSASGAGASSSSLRCLIPMNLSEEE